MRVRNFWIDANIDGRKTGVGTGPRTENGGFNLRISMREKGSISIHQIGIDGREVDGESVLTVSEFYQDGKKTLARITTKR